MPVFRNYKVKPDTIKYSLNIQSGSCEALPYADKLIELLQDWDTHEFRAAIKRSLGDFEGAEQDNIIARGIPKDECK